MFTHYKGIDISKLKATLSNKLDNSLSTLGNNRYLTDWYFSPTQWYRVWSDNWCEQGGCWLSTSANYDAQLITLLKPYRDTNYIAHAMPGYSNGDLWAPKIGEKTTTTIQFYYIYNSTTCANWYACGYMS